VLIGAARITPKHVIASIHLLRLWSSAHEGETMLILLIILLVLAFGAFPTWPYSRGWGYYPSGGLGLILLIVLIVVLVNGGL
jgi:hypothetical protein